MNIFFCKKSNNKKDIEMKLKFILGLLAIFGFAVGCVSTELQPRFNYEWITPSKSVCISNGGKIIENTCFIPWNNANKMCSSIGGGLPSSKILKNILIDCGGTLANDFGKIADKNINNNKYTSCYKNQGFVTGGYWSSSINNSNTNQARYVNFYNGVSQWYLKSRKNRVRCIKNH